MIAQPAMHGCLNIVLNYVRYHVLLPAFVRSLCNCSMPGAVGSSHGSRTAKSSFKAGSHQFVLINHDRQLWYNAVSL